MSEAPDKLLITGEDRFLGYSLMCGAEAALIGMAAACTDLQAELLRSFWRGDAGAVPRIERRDRRPGPANLRCPDGRLHSTHALVPGAPGRHPRWMRPTTPGDRPSIRPSSIASGRVSHDWRGYDRREDLRESRPVEDSHVSAHAPTCFPGHADVPPELVRQGSSGLSNASPARACPRISIIISGSPMAWT